MIPICHLNMLIKEVIFKPLVTVISIIIKVRPRAFQTPHFSCETTISGRNNVRPHTFHARLQYQAATMSDPTLFMRDYNIRPQQCQTPHFSCETTISGRNNVRPHTFHARLQYQAATMSDPTLFMRDYNIRPQKCQTPHFLYETTISGPKRFVRDYKSCNV